MRLTDDGLDTYLASVAGLLDRYGFDVADGALAIDQAPGARRLGVRARLPGGSSQAVVELRETWVEAGAGTFERAEYVYELIDRERDFRRAWHLHDPGFFARHFRVLVHEHCERPIGTAFCDHYAGRPVRDAFAGVDLIVDAWTDPIEPDCGALHCLEPS